MNATAKISSATKYQLFSSSREHLSRTRISIVRHPSWCYTSRGHPWVWFVDLRRLSQPFNYYFSNRWAIYAPRRVDLSSLRAKKKDEKEGKERRTQRERERGGGRSRDGFEWECVDKSTDHRPQIRKFDSPCKLPRWIIRSSTRVTESLPPSFPRIISFVIALITGPGYFVNSRSMFS